MPIFGGVHTLQFTTLWIRTSDDRDILVDLKTLPLPEPPPSHPNREPHYAWAWQVYCQFVRLTFGEDGTTVKVTGLEMVPDAEARADGVGGEEWREFCHAWKGQLVL
jgi:hypothetical protein